MSRSRKSAGGGRKATTEKPKPAEKQRGKSNSELVDQAIQAFDNKIEEKNVSVGDFVRLLQLRKEIDGDEPKEITVTWVEPGETESSEE